MMHDWGMGWGGMWLGPLAMVGLLVLWAVLIVALLRSVNSRREDSGIAHPTPREILDERLAKGEIDRNDYVERRKSMDLGVAAL